MNIRCRIVSTVLCLLAVVLLASSSAIAQTGAASLTGIVSDHERFHRAWRNGHRDQPGHERDLHGGVERGRQLHRHVAARRDVCRQGRAVQLQDGGDQADPGRGEQIVRIDFKLELGALAETVEVSGESQVLQTESATVGEVISGTTLSALPLNGRNTGQLSLLLPGRRDAEPRLVHRRPQLRRRPAVREREPRADQQLHDRRRRHERDDRQPRRLSAES